MKTWTLDERVELHRVIHDVAAFAKHTNKQNKKCCIFASKVPYEVYLAIFPTYFTLSHVRASSLLTKQRDGNLLYHPHIFPLYAKFQCFLLGLPSYRRNIKCVLQSGDSRCGHGGYQTWDLGSRSSFEIATETRKIKKILVTLSCFQTFLSFSNACKNGNTSTYIDKFIIE